MLEKSYDYDVHANASTSLGRIVIAEPLFKHHGQHPDEIISVLFHELGHYKLSHLSKSTIIDTFYMVLFGTFLWLLTNKEGFLLSFGINHDSYFASFIFFVLLYKVSCDVPLRLGLRKLSRYHELQADAFAVNYGFGEPMLNALIRSHADSLDNIFISRLD